MQIKWIEDFLILTDAHAFSRAAERRNVSQPTFSRHIQALEDWLGGPLVLQDVSVRWQDSQGRLLASVSGLDVVWTPLVTPKGRRVSHLDFRAAEIQVVNGPRIADLRLEMVAVAGQRFLVNLQAADWGGAEPPPAPGAEARELLDAMDAPLDVRP